MRKWFRILLWLMAAGTVMVALPIGGGLVIAYGEWSGTSQARVENRGSTGQAPDPATYPEAVVQVYTARAARWRGVLGSHSWIVVKPAGATEYARYEVMGWSAGDGENVVKRRNGVADHYWFGYRPERVADVRGPAAEALIPRIEAAIGAYPYADEYRIWPGPNSNTFTAYIGRSVPGLRINLPPTAIGKDYLGPRRVADRAPSGTGLQLSLHGAAGVLVAWDEGVEINLLGLVYGVDFTAPALKMPGVGRIGMQRHPGDT